MDLTSRIGDTARSLAMKKGFIKIVTMIDNKSLSHVPIRADPRLGESYSVTQHSVTQHSKSWLSYLHLHPTPIMRPQIVPVLGVAFFVGVVSLNSNP